MDPRHDPDLILGHLEGELSPEDAAKIQALIEADPDFAALLKGMAEDRAQLRAAPAAQPPAGMADMAVADLERSMLLDDAADSLAMPTPGRRRFALAPLLTYGAIAAVLALTANAVLKSVQPPAPLPPVASAPPEHAFDIAAATIQTQRDLARRDQAEVGFDGGSAGSGDEASDASAPQEVAAAAPDASLSKSIDAQAMNQAPSPQGHFAALAAEDASPKHDAFTLPTEADTNTAALPPRVAGEPISIPVAAANQGISLATTGSDAALVQTALARQASRPRTSGLAAQTREEVLANGLAEPSIDAEHTEPAEHNALAAEPASPTPRAWTHTLQSIGDDWTRWTTFGADPPIAPAPIAPTLPLH